MENASATRHVAWLRNLMSRRGYDAVVVRNNADIRWLTGAARVMDDEVAHTAFITSDGLWLHTDSRYYNAFVTKLGDDGAWKVDMDPVDHASWVAARAGQARVRVLAVEDTLTLAFYERLCRALSDASLACAMPRMHGDIVEARSVKDDGEIAAMRAAQAVTDRAFSHMCEVIRPGLTEMQLRAELDNFMLSNGADALAFDSIVASGPNSANPHAKPGARVVESGDFVLMDFGAALGDYRSDMTRTVCVGEPSRQQREIYDLVRSVNEACEAYAKPGLLGRQVHELAVRMISDAGYGDCFGHGLGHGVGIDIHEEPRFSARDCHVLVPGNVVTVEPGVYLPGVGGVRLEDFGVITADGYEPFTQSSHELVVLPG